MRYFTALLITATLAFSCKSTKNTTVPADDNDLVISISKGACFGKCPVYTFEIYKGGYCTFYGKRNTSKKGKHALKIEKEDYNALVDAFKEANFFEYEDHYESNIADLPSVSITFIDKGNKKSVTGKRERPESLHKLQFKLEEIAEKDADWTLIEAAINDDPAEKEPKLLKSQIILTTNGGPQLAKWFDKMRIDHSLRIMKKLSGTNDMWLVSFNPSKHTPEEMLSILQNDPFVKSAEFNQEVEKR